MADVHAVQAALFVSLVLPPFLCLAVPGIVRGPLFRNWER